MASCLGDILVMTSVDVINAFVLLSGIIMLPTNIHILYFIANNKKIDYKSKVVCCPLWLCIVWIIIVNFVAVIICIHRIRTCEETTAKHISVCMQHYRGVQRYKHFLDNLQWSLKCCGLNSYKDWFKHDWYDKIRDYEWDPNTNKRNTNLKSRTGTDKPFTDSVPLSCCKSGSCISNYLSELGTYSINTKGCGHLMHRFIMISMSIHLFLFLVIILAEALILQLIISNNVDVKLKDKSKNDKYNVRHIMSVNDNFDASSTSCQYNPEESDDDDDSSRHLQVEQFKKDIYKAADLIHANEEYSERRTKISK